jgi:hypothetical protein
MKANCWALHGKKNEQANRASDSGKKGTKNHEMAFFSKESELEEYVCRPVGPDPEEEDYSVPDEFFDSFESAPSTDSEEEDNGRVPLWQDEEMRRVAGLDEYLESDESTEPDTNEWKVVELKLGMRNRRTKTKNPTLKSHATKYLVRKVPDRTCKRGKMATTPKLPKPNQSAKKSTKRNHFLPLLTFTTKVEIKTGYYTSKEEEETNNESTDHQDKPPTSPQRKRGGDPDRRRCRSLSGWAQGQKEAAREHEPLGRGIGKRNAGKQNTSILPVHGSRDRGGKGCRSCSICKPTGHDGGKCIRYSHSPHPNSIPQGLDARNAGMVRTATKMAGDGPWNENGSRNDAESILSKLLPPRKHPSRNRNKRGKRRKLNIRTTDRSTGGCEQYRPERHQEVLPHEQPTHGHSWHERFHEES